MGKRENGCPWHSQFSWDMGDWGPSAVSEGDIVIVKLVTKKIYGVGCYLNLNQLNKWENAFFEKTLLVFWVFNLSHGSKMLVR